jgi:hypothetical protein
MSKLDQFASAFKSAAKEIYSYTDIEIGKVLIVTDLPEDHSRLFCDDLRDFLSVVGDRDDVVWDPHPTEPGDNVGDLLDEIESERPDLICCYRNIHGRARSYPFSLGAYVDVLTQATSTPVLLLPPPTDSGRLASTCENTKNVMVLTDHLTGCDRLIDHGVRFVESGGHLTLAHLEDDATFERYIETIGKIPALDTDVARQSIRDKLLKEPSDYINSVRSALDSQLNEVTIDKEVRMGHRIVDCRKLIADHDIDLVVMNTKDAEQLAMHGLAYPLAIELRDIPLLLL